MLRFRSRPDASFSNLAKDWQWFQSGVIYEGEYVPTKVSVVRVFPPDGRGTPVDVSASLLERIE